MKMNDLITRFGALFALFEAAGHQLFLVGGSVRDLALQSTPKDFDFCTDATPKQILEAAGLRTLLIGERFGMVATVFDSEDVEITTFREESYTPDSRKPEVVFGNSLHVDLGRRDFTINAMAMSSTGQIVDPFNGQADIKNKIIRCPGDPISILRDDPLRILRAARFASRLGFQIEDSLTEAAKAQSHALSIVSHERWFQEMTKVLCSPHPEIGLSWLQMVGALNAMGIPIVHMHFVARLQCVKSNTAARWAGLMMALAVEVKELDCVADAFKFSNALRSEVVALWTCANTHTAATAVGIRKLHARVAPHTENGICFAGAMRDIPVQVFLDVLHVQECEGTLEPMLPVGMGNFVAAHLKVKPGPVVGVVLSWLREQMIEGALPFTSTAAECMVAWDLKGK